MKTILLRFLLILFVATNSFSQEIIPLYKKSPKESNGLTVSESFRDATFLTDISNPRMQVFLSPKEKANGTAVVICPGGGYKGVAFMHEGTEVAHWFNSMGISAFVLYYRMPNGHSSIPLEDAQTALKIIHKRAKEWNIDKNKIGIMGFSAGGHLASTVGTHFKNKVQRPSFMILGYPVISMKNGITHLGSRKNLMGDNPKEEQVNLYSNEMQVATKTPPTFIVHASDDKAVPIKNSILFYKSLKENKVEVELDSFAVGGHGFGMKRQNSPVDNWLDLLKEWLLKHNLL